MSRKALVLSAATDSAVQKAETQRDDMKLGRRGVSNDRSVPIGHGHSGVGMQGPSGTTTPVRLSLYVECFKIVPGPAMGYAVTTSVIIGIALIIATIRCEWYISLIVSSVRCED